MKLTVVQREENKRDYFRAIIDQLNDEHARIKAANPHGYIDEMESRIEALTVDIVSALGGCVTFNGDNATATFPA